jgi:hypothetical protein
MTCSGSWDKQQRDENENPVNQRRGS